LNVVGSYLKLRKKEKDLSPLEAALSCNGSGEAVTLFALVSQREISLW
jgi:hypothetical protein